MTFWLPGRGLGYYARARNLHAAAKVVANEMGGKFPPTAESLRALPGVGGYTAGAISAIAYDERQAAMDANAERVIARLYAVETPMPKAKTELHARCSALVPDRAGDFAQALMDLGSAICTPSGRPVPTALDRGLQGEAARHSGAVAGESAEDGPPAQAWRGVCRARQKRSGAAGQAPGQGFAGIHAGTAAGTVGRRLPDQTPRR